MTFDPWRLACPHGHRSVIRVGGKTHSGFETKLWRCNSCKDNDGINGYHYSQVEDLKTGDMIDP